MAHPEHDAALGRLAAARLRAASAGVRLDAHPDAETWAAYADGGLVPDEMAALDAHLAACASCRRLVVALTPEPAAAASAVEVDEAPGPARVLPFRPRVTWAWMSIAAGLLGAVTIWSVIRIQQPPMASTMAGRTEAARDAGAMARPPEESIAPAPPPPDAARPATSAASPAATPPPGGAAASARIDELDRAKAGLEKKAIVAASGDDRDRAARALREARANAVPLAEALKPEATGRGAATTERVVVTQAVPPAPAAAARAPATEGVHGPAVNVQQQNMQALNAQKQAQAAQAAQVAAAQAAEQEKLRAGAPAEVPRQAAVSPPPVARPSPPPPAPEPQAVGDVADRAPVAGPPPPAARSGARRQGFDEAKRDVSVTRERAEAALADASTAIVFAEPGGRLRWRIAGGSRIESSSDAGVTWTSRYPEAAERLRAGSAPAIDTAWAVGERGLVLRFVVPGTWTPVARPTAATLVGVTASSADAARVTAEDGRVFETSDGGRTWRAIEGTGVPPR